MKFFNYQVTWLSFWVKPQVFLVNTKQDVDHLIFHGKDQQYKVKVEKGKFTL